jgi:hypothetical protein
MRGIGAGGVVTGYELGDNPRPGARRLFEQSASPGS